MVLPDPELHQLVSEESDQMVPAQDHQAVRAAAYMLRTPCGRVQDAERGTVPAQFKQAADTRPAHRAGRPGVRPKFLFRAVHTGAERRVHDIARQAHRPVRVRTFHHRSGTVRRRHMVIHAAGGGDQN